MSSNVLAWSSTYYVKIWYWDIGAILHPYSLIVGLDTYSTILFRWYWSVQDFARRKEMELSQLYHVTVILGGWLWLRRFLRPHPMISHLLQKHLLQRTFSLSLSETATIACIRNRQQSCHRANQTILGPSIIQNNLNLHILRILSHPPSGIKDPYILFYTFLYTCIQECGEEAVAGCMAAAAVKVHQCHRFI